MRQLLTGLAWRVLERWWDDWLWTVYVDDDPRAEIRDGADHDSAAVFQYVCDVMAVYADRYPGDPVTAKRTISRIAGVDELVWEDGAPWPS